MSTASDNNLSGDEDVLGRADVLLNKHRAAAAKPATDPNTIPTLTEAVDADAMAIPTLTDIIAAPVAADINGGAEAHAAAPEPAAPPPMSEPDTNAVADSEDALTPPPAQGGEVVSHVQAQDLEHGVYEKLKQQLDSQIAGVLQERFMPEIAGALDQALHKISDDLKANINAMVRASIEDTLQAQIKNLRLSAESQLGKPTDTTPASGIMRGFSGPATPTPAKMELAKSFEPHAIESRWYPEWERRGYFAAGLDHKNPASFCILLPPPNVTGTLHMGHAFQQTLMDALVRYHRMRGYNTNWVAGTDHAGIATQIVVERQLEAEGKTRHDLGRDAIRQTRVGMEAGVRLHHHAPDAPARRLGQLGLRRHRRPAQRLLHDGRENVARRGRSVRAAARGRPDLPRQAARQLGPGARHRGVRPRGRQRGGRRQDLGDPLSAGGRQRRAGRRDDAA